MIFQVSTMKSRKPSGMKPVDSQKNAFPGAVHPINIQQYYRFS